MITSCLYMLDATRRSMNLCVVSEVYNKAEYKEECFYVCVITYCKTAYV